MLPMAMVKSAALRPTPDAIAPAANAPTEAPNQTMSIAIADPRPRIHSSSCSM